MMLLSYIQGGMDDLEEGDRRSRGCSSSSSDLFFSLLGRVVAAVIRIVYAPFTKVCPF
jgi:hypothetical protein